ncbi:hypothetical protein ANO11243_092420 [Dothideomycetidae sp. 11243]|nr:hypothetical protein ANO11243_092420 [fungal sp. No.11243]
MELISLGGTWIVLKVRHDLAMKYASEYENAAERVRAEYDVYEHLEKQPWSPYLCRSIYRTERLHFLKLASGGDLNQAIRKFQVRDPTNDRVVTSVSQHFESALIYKWVDEICAAAAWLENQGLAHGDLRPENILLTHDNSIKLTDFDNTLKIGQEVEVGGYPYVRELEEFGPIGPAGAQTEQFATGSIIFILIVGHEPYEDQWFGKDGGERHGLVVSRLLRLFQFPPVPEDNPSSEIIQNCWHGRYSTIAALHEAMKACRSEHACSIGMDSSSDTADRAVRAGDTPEKLQEMRLACIEMVDGGIEEQASRYLGLSSCM